MNEEQNNGGQENNQMPSEDINQPFSPSKVNTLKDGVRRTARAAGKAVKNAAKAARKAAKIALKIGKAIVKFIISNPYVAAALAITAIVFLVACMIIDKFNLDSLTEATDSSVSAKISSWDSSNLNEQQSNAKSEYEKTGGFNWFSIADIDDIVDNLDKKSKDKSINEDILNVYRQLLAKVGSNEEYSKARIVSPDDNQTLFKHMLLTSKYNFNAIKWKRYGHTYNGEDSPLKDDLDLGVRYPEDESNTDYKTFNSLVSPYLTCYEILAAMFSGLLSNENHDSANAVNYTYTMIKYGLADITVNRYDIKKCDLKTNYKIYDATKYRSVVTIKVTPVYKQVTLPGGNVVNVLAGHTVSCMGVNPKEQVGETEKDHNTRLNENGVEDVMKEEEMSKEISYKNQYIVKSAKTFDTKVENNITYVPYSDADADARINPNKKNTIDPVPYAETIDKENIINSAIDVNGCSSIEDVMNRYGMTIIGQGAEGNSTIYTLTKGTYEERNGTQYNINRVWEDDCSSSSTSEYYTVDDLIEFNENFNENKISGDDIKSDLKAYNYYKRLENLKKLNWLDIVDSNPFIYKKYLYDNNNNYSGIDHDYLEDFCYDNMVELFENVMSKNGGRFPYVYGRTLGITNNSGSNSSASVGASSGFSLLREYVRKLEGHEGLNSDGTKYRIGLVSGNRTVGYGVDIDAGGYAETFTSMGYSINVGDYIDVDVVDKIEEQELRDNLQNMVDLTDGLGLEEYQIHALVSRGYNCGFSGATWGKYTDGVDFITAYNTYWNKDQDNKYSELFEKYGGEDITSSSHDAIKSAVNYSNALYQNYLRIPTNPGTDVEKGLIARRESEFTLFQTGYYDNLRKFWRAGAGQIEDINLYNSDGSVNINAIKELQASIQQTFNFVDCGNQLTTHGGSGNATGMAGSVVNFSQVIGTKLEYTDRLSIYQCTWWANGRAGMFLTKNYPDKFPQGYPTAMGHGHDFLDENHWFQSSTDAMAVRPNSLVVYDKPGHEYGHVAYVEAVDEVNGKYYISHCGSGDSWHGIYELNIGEACWSKGWYIKGYIYLDSPL